ncbi:MAG TPA: hypothetical protein VGP68_21125 [Gemmataceae bacterium]|jgi:hypothetical protein|nr:hypothetical protein [Gemmataceae bacterium]
MPESFAERLSAFTPDGTGLDRDALLFAAGRAAAHVNRGWTTLACTLAASQLLTLVLFWPKSPAPMNIVSEESRVPSNLTQIQPSSDREAGDFRALDSRAFAWRDGDLPPASPIESMAPESPPLHALDRSLLSN